MKNVVPVNDHLLLREGLARTIEAEDLDVVGRMDNAEEAGDDTVDDIVKAIRKGLDGRIFVSEKINEWLPQSMAEGGRKRITQSPLEVLSDRELEVFELTGRGISTRAPPSTRFH